VLLPEYRGFGLGKRFFARREAHARSLTNPEMEEAVFCAVERPADHPARPADYRPLDEFWERQGYRREPRLQAQYPWKDVGAEVETEKPLTFWRKRL
jgi:GNAT superfamily N-acetyltransferase